MKVYWTHSATRDLQALEIYIAQDSPSYARQFVAKILASTRKLESFPKIGRKVPEAEREDIRELIFQHYRIIYRETGNEVHILAVLHGSRNLSTVQPKPWEVG